MGLFQKFLGIMITAGIIGYILSYFVLTEINHTYTMIGALVIGFIFFIISAKKRTPF